MSGGTGQLDKIYKRNELLAENMCFSHPEGILLAKLSWFLSAPITHSAIGWVGVTSLSWGRKEKPSACFPFSLLLGSELSVESFLFAYICEKQVPRQCMCLEWRSFSNSGVQCYVVHLSMLSNNSFIRNKINILTVIRQCLILIS